MSSGKPSREAQTKFRESFSLQNLQSKYASFLQSSPSSPLPASQHRHQVNEFPAVVLHQASLPERLNSAIDTALSHAWSPASKANHRTALNRFLEFCNNNSVPQEDRFPASELLLCAFIASCTNRAPSTVKNYISGIRAFHITKGLPWHGSTRLQYVRDGVVNFSGTAVNSKPPRPPVTRDMLQALYNNLDRTSPQDICILACASVAFWGQARLGELLLESALPVPNPLPVPSPSDVRSNTMASITMTLPHTKVKKWTGEEITLTQQLDASNPVQALDLHLSINKLPPHLPLFSFRVGLETRVLTKQHFLSACNNIWSKSGLPRYTGHSFRIGGTTALLLAGVQPSLVKEMGRWASDAYKLYWRDFHTLIPLNAQNLPLAPLPHSKSSGASTTLG